MTTFTFLRPVLVVVCAHALACSRDDSEQKVVPSAEEPPPPNTAKLRADADERAVQSAVRVKRGDLTEEWILSSNLAGCELTRDKIGRNTDSRMRLSWTMAIDFTTGERRAINPWWLLFERGRAGHGPLDVAELRVEPESGDKRRAKLTLAPVAWQRHTVAASGAVTLRECTSDAASAKAIDTLRVVIGKVPVGIRGVILFEREADGKLSLQLSTSERACNDFDEAELLLMTTMLGDEPIGLTLMGRAIPRPPDSPPLHGDAELTITHPPLPKRAKQIEVAVEGKAVLNARKAVYRDLAVRISGQASARVCREADTKKRSP